LLLLFRYGLNPENFGYTLAHYDASVWMDVPIQKHPHVGL